MDFTFALTKGFNAQYDSRLVCDNVSSCSQKMDYHILLILSFKGVKSERQEWIDHQFNVCFQDDVHVITLDLPDVVDYWKFVPLAPLQVNHGKCN